MSPNWPARPPGILAVHLQPINESIHVEEPVASNIIVQNPRVRRRKPLITRYFRVEPPGPPTSGNQVRIDQREYRPFEIKGGGCGNG